MSTASQSHLMEVKNVAEELNCKPIAVKRLIAWQLLDASRLSGGSEWRITRAALDRYIEAGAQKSEMPAVENNGWLSEDLRYHSERLVEAIEKAAKPQFLTVDGVREKKPDASGRMPDVVLKLTPEILAVFNGPAPESAIPGEREKYAGKFASWGQLYLVNQLRAQALMSIRGMRPRTTEPHLQRLYSSPEDFKAILKATVQAALNRKFVFTQNLDWQTEKVEGLNNEVVTEKHFAKITYLLPWNLLVNEATLMNYAHLAF